MYPQVQHAPAPNPAYALDAQVAELARKGYSVESRTPTQVTLIRQRKIGWFFHTILTLITSGLWLIRVAWLLVNRDRRAERVTLTARPDGSVKRS